MKSRGVEGARREDVRKTIRLSKLDVGGGETTQEKWANLQLQLQVKDPRTHWLAAQVIQALSVRVLLDYSMKYMWLL